MSVASSALRVVSRVVLLLDGEPTLSLDARGEEPWPEGCAEAESAAPFKFLCVLVRLESVAERFTGPMRRLPLL